MRQSLIDLFLELAQPDKNGKSRWVYVTEFVGRYKALELGNGWSWGRASSPLQRKFKVEVDCANCANKMEEAAKKTEGVKDCTVNFMALKMNVEFEEGADPKAVMQDVLKNCKKVEDDCEIFL